MLPKQDYTAEFKELAVKRAKAGQTAGAVANDLGLISFETRDEVIVMTFEYVKVFYNRKRLCSTLSYKSPMQFLSDWLVAQQQEKLVA